MQGPSSRSYTGTRETLEREEFEQKRTLLNEELVDRQRAVDAARRRRRNTIWALVVIIVVIVAATIAAAIMLYYYVPIGNGGSSSPTTPSGSGSVPLGESCTSASSCMSGLICSGGVCTNPPQTPCTTAATCPAGYACAAGVCKGLINAECSSNADCSGQFICPNSICIATPCTSDAQCPNATTVNNEYCDTTSGVCIGGHLDACSSNSQCNNAFYTCVTNECVGLVGDPCTETSQCAEPYVCTNDMCAVQNCVTSTDCTHAIGPFPFGVRCDAPGVCANGVFAVCTQQAQCGSPTIATCTVTSPQEGACTPA
jgi:hypothetical protein